MRPSGASRQPATLRREVLQAVMSATAGSSGGVLMTRVLQEVLSRRPSEGAACRRAVRDILREGVELGILQKDSRRRYSLDGRRRVVAATRKVEEEEEGGSAERSAATAEEDDDEASLSSGQLAREADETLDQVLADGRRRGVRRTRSCRWGPFRVRGAPDGDAAADDGEAPGPDLQDPEDDGGPGERDAAPDGDPMPTEHAPASTSADADAPQAEEPVLVLRKQPSLMHFDQSAAKDIYS